MSAVLGGVAVRRHHPGMVSGRVPTDLRTEDPRPVGTTESEAVTATALVRKRLGEHAAPVLAMLGIEVAS